MAHLSIIVKENILLNAFDFQEKPGIEIHALTIHLS